jgi:MFS transporter, FLVCR family, MFS-domain-containing protein 7
MGAALLLSGILAAIITSPILDRVLTHHLGPAVRIMCPIIAAAWLSLIWAGKNVLLLFSLISLSLAKLIIVRPHNDAALFAIFVVIGVCSIALLPVAVELGVELTRNSDGSSAVLWFLCALCFFTELPHQRLISFV